MEKSYYAIIPANVRYDEDLSANAKLLYGELTALSNEKGYCWAGNSYFADLYSVTNRSISNWINTLEKKNYIKRELIRDENQQIKERRIYISGGMENNFMTYGNNFHEGGEKKFRGNTTSINNTDNIYILFQHWNEQGIIKHRKMNQAMKSHINARLEDYSVEELKKAIENYSLILGSDDYYWTHKWSLQDFMKPNNVIRFVDESDPFNNFRSTFKATKKKGEIDLNEFDLDD